MSFATATHADEVCALPEGVFFSHSFKTPPKDAGAGLVTQWMGFVGSGERFSIRDCDSNTLIFADVGNATFDDDPLVGLIEETFATMHRSPKVYTVEELMAAFRNIGAKSSTTDGLNQEDCGCSVFYPELQGQKIAYEDPYDRH